MPSYFLSASTAHVPRKNTSGSPHTLIIDNRPTRIYALDKAEHGLVLPFRVLCTIQSKRGKKASILVDWDSEVDVGRAPPGKGGGLHQVVGRARALFIAALLNGDVGGGKRDATGGTGLSVCRPFVCEFIFPSLRYHYRKLNPSSNTGSIHVTSES
ncbi:hypothetical protein ARMGADRAFT_1090145 [Armillaria gallica]|uniref:Uncharacterized protein n=1 Tax=Armillaria gallica TaxID=47427 RepID=A0A2H3CHX1_ARMGA|nr:hypothetical protein ARMGADRAFT_1090145 [Armillaria gallica]